MKYNILLISILTSLLYACGTKNNEVTIPKASSVENLSEASLNILNEAIEEDPSNAFLYYKRALFYSHHHSSAKALLDINKAVELDDEKGDYYLLQGEVYYATGNVLLAKEAATKAETILDNVPALMVLQSNIYLDLRDTIKYNQYIHKTVQLIPFKADADFVQARKYLIDKDSVRSLNYFQSAVQKDADYLPAYKEIIKIYMNKAMYDSSMSYVLNGIRISHLDPLFYEAEGRFFEKVKLYGAAESAYLIALKYSNNNPEYYKLLADLKYQQNDYNKALNWYSQLLLVRPRDKEVLIRCAESSFKAEKWSKASSYYAKLIRSDTLNSSFIHHYKIAVKKAYDEDSLYAVKEENTSVEVQPAPIEVKPKTESVNVNKIEQPVVKEESIVKKITPAAVEVKEKVIKKKDTLKVKVSTEEETVSKPSSEKKEKTMKESGIKMEEKQSVDSTASQ